eukprot:m.195876 g.195876  ORF g.195876 m.195876 type:complete len:802 (-) comp25837_c0_seq1:107-2512(-)
MDSEDEIFVVVDDANLVGEPSEGKPGRKHRTRRLFKKINGRLRSLSGTFDRSASNPSVPSGLIHQATPPPPRSTSDPASDPAHQTNSSGFPSLQASARMSPKTTIHQGVLAFKDTKDDRHSNGRKRTGRHSNPPTASNSQPEASSSDTQLHLANGENPSSSPEASPSPSHRHVPVSRSPKPKEDERKSFSRQLHQSLSDSAKAVKKLFVAQKDNETFHSLFQDLPEEEILLDDFVCALQRDILVQGRLYVSQNYLCFHSNILGWETMLYLSLEDIIAIRKEKTALVIPNAIQLTTRDGTKRTFTSFLTRDRAFRCLYKVWTNALLEEPLAPQDLLQGVTRDWRGGAQRPLTSTTPQPSLPSDDEYLDPMSEAPAVVGGRQTSSSSEGPLSRQSSGTSPVNPSPLHKSISKAPKTPRSRKHNKAKKALIRRQRTQSGSSTTSIKGSDRPATLTRSVSNVPVTCPCPSHEGKQLLDTIVPCSLEVLVRLIFTEHEFFRSFLKRMKISELTAEDWGKDAEGTPKRQLNYTLALSYPIGPKTTAASETQWHRVRSTAEVHIFEAEVRTPNVPYGDNFYTCTKYCMTFQSPKETRLKVHAQVKYRKGAPWSFTKNLIERNSFDGLRKHFEQLHTHLLEFLRDTDPSALYEEEEKAREERPTEAAEPRPKRSRSETSVTGLSRSNSVSERISALPTTSPVSTSQKEELPEQRGLFGTSWQPQVPPQAALQRIFMVLLILLNIFLLYWIFTTPAYPSLTFSDLPAAGDTAAWQALFLEQQRTFLEQKANMKEQMQQLQAVLQKFADSL